MTTAVMAVDLDLAVRRGRMVERRTARHTLVAGRVHLLETVADGVRTRTVDIAAWRTELAEFCAVSGPGDDPAPVPTADLPWDLVVGTGAARAGRRDDVCSELLGRADGAERDHVARLHSATCGRLRAVGALPRRHVGWVAWVLFADGWRALTPYAGTGPQGRRPMVRLERRDPGDLAHDVARWAAGAVR